MSSELVSVEALLRRGDLILVQDGNHGGNYPKVEEFCETGVPLITGACLDAGQISFASSGYISEERAAKLRVGFARAGDVLLTHKGTMGKTALVQKSVHPFLILNPQITLYRVNVDGCLRAKYLKYYFDSSFFQDYLVRISSTSTISTLPIKEQKKLEIPILPVEDQDSICSVLGALDDRITLLRETNATLEAIAQALFKSWFVDFDPVRAKMEGRAPEGMDEATAALFPDGLEESALGLVPRGWRVGQLGHEVKIAYGKNLPTSKLLESGYPVYGGNGQIGFSDKFLYEGRQVLVACRGAASGKFNQSVPRSFVTNNSLVLESSDATPLPFGYLKGCISCADLIPFVTGSAQPQVTIDNLKNFKLLVPSVFTVRVFESFSSPLEDKIEENNQQAQTLATLRDTLLPRLISGALRLPVAAMQIEDATL